MSMCGVIVAFQRSIKTLFFDKNNFIRSEEMITFHIHTCTYILAAILKVVGSTFRLRAMLKAVRYS